MLRTALATLATIAVPLALGCTLPEVGTDGDACNDCTFEPLSATPVPVASCVRDDLTVTCQWADEEALALAPLSGLQSGLSLWRTQTERIEATSNDDTQIVYDLSNSIWEVGDPLIFRTSLQAGFGDELIPIADGENILSSDETAAGVDLNTGYEVWDVGLIANQNLSASLSFAAGPMALNSSTYQIKPISNVVLRFVVDPAVGLDIYSGQTLAVHVAQPGYYLFTAPDAAEYDPDPDTVD